MLILLFHYLSLLRKQIWSLQNRAKVNGLDSVKPKWLNIWSKEQFPERKRERFFQDLLRESLENNLNDNIHFLSMLQNNFEGLLIASTHFLHEKDCIFRKAISFEKWITHCYPATEIYDIFYSNTTSGSWSF